MKFRLKKNKKGFTLIELVCVIALMAVMVAIAVPVIGNSQQARAEKTYKESVVYACDQAQSVCDAINDGVRSMSGCVICASGSSEMRNNSTQIEQLLAGINSMDYKFSIMVVSASEKETAILQIKSFYSDTVILQIANVDENPPSASYDKKGNKSIVNARSVTNAYYFEAGKGWVYKYDYTKGSGSLIK